MTPDLLFYRKMAQESNSFYETKQQWMNAMEPNMQGKFYCQVKTASGAIFQGWILCTADLETSPLSFGEARLHVPYQLIEDGPILTQWANDNASKLLDADGKIVAKVLGDNVKIGGTQQSNTDEITISRHSKSRRMKKGDEVIVISRLVNREAWRTNAKNIFKNPNEVKIASLLGFIKSMFNAFQMEITPIDASLLRSIPKN
jgi:hypothetical protein